MSRGQRWQCLSSCKKSSLTQNYGKRKAAFPLRLSEYVVLRIPPPPPSVFYKDFPFPMLFVRVERLSSPSHFSPKENGRPRFFQLSCPNLSWFFDRAMSLFCSAVPICCGQPIAPQHIPFVVTRKSGVCLQERASPLLTSWSRK